MTTKKPAKRWVPDPKIETQQAYWTIVEAWGKLIVHKAWCTFEYEDRQRIKIGNCFRTKRDAERMVLSIIKFLKEE